MTALADARARVRAGLQAVAGATPPYAPPDLPENMRNWPAFLASLRARHVVRLSIGQELRFLGLVARLGHERTDLSDADTVADLLAPVLAASDDEIQIVRREIRTWLAADGGRAHEPAGGETLVGQFQRSGWLALGAGALGLVAVAALLFYGDWSRRGFGLPDSSPIEPNPNITKPLVWPGLDLIIRLLPTEWTPILQKLGSGLLLAAPVLLIVLGILIRRQKATETILRSRGEAISFLDIPVPIPERPLLDDAAAQTVMRALHDWQQLRSVPSAEIDVAATIRSAARNFGRPDWQYRSRRARPAYVMLVDRGGAGDHMALIASAVENRLRSAGTVFERYDYSGDPRRVWASAGLARLARPEDLMAVAARHRGERLLLLSDGETLGGAAQGAFRDAVSMFSRAVMLNPTPERSWGAREAALIDAGVLVVPASPDGFVRAISAFGEGAEDSRAAATAGIEEDDDPFLAQLRRERSRYLADVPPPEREVERLVRRIRSYLSDFGLYELFVAIGAFPQIDPYLTVYLSKAIRDEPLDLREAGVLARMPWLRTGRMPDWLRTALLESLDDDEADRLRRIFTVVLQTLPRNPDATLPDPGAIHARSKVTLAATPRLIDRLFGGGVALGFGEHIFVGFMKREPLSIEAPQQMRLPWHARLDAYDYATLALGAIAAALIFYFQPTLMAALRSVPEQAVRSVLLGLLLAMAGAVAMHVLSHGAGERDRTLSTAPDTLRGQLHIVGRVGAQTASMVLVLMLLALPIGGLPARYGERFHGWLLAVVLVHGAALAVAGTIQARLRDPRQRLANIALSGTASVMTAALVMIAATWLLDGKVRASELGSLAAMLVPAAVTGACYAWILDNAALGRRLPRWGAATVQAVATGSAAVAALFQGVDVMIIYVSLNLIIGALLGWYVAAAADRASAPTGSAVPAGGTGSALPLFTPIAATGFCCLFIAPVSLGLASVTMAACLAAFCIAILVSPADPTAAPSGWHAVASRGILHDELLFPSALAGTLFVGLTGAARFAGESWPFWFLPLVGAAASFGWSRWPPGATSRRAVLIAVLLWTFWAAAATAVLGVAAFSRQPIWPASLPVGVLETPLDAALLLSFVLFFWLDRRLRPWLAPPGADRHWRQATNHLLIALAGDLLILLTLRTAGVWPLSAPFAIAPYLFWWQQNRAAFLAQLERPASLTRWQRWTLEFQHSVIDLTTSAGARSQAARRRLLWGLAAMAYGLVAIALRYAWTEPGLGNDPLQLLRYATGAFGPAESRPVDLPSLTSATVGLTFGASVLLCGVIFRRMALAAGTTAAAPMTAAAADAAVASVWQAMLGWARTAALLAGGSLAFYGLAHDWVVESVRLPSLGLLLPAAVFAAWRWGRSARWCMLAGALPLLVTVPVGDIAVPAGLSIAIETSGGVWGIAVVLLWMRLTADPAARARLAATTRIDVLQLALLCLALAPTVVDVSSVLPPGRIDPLPMLLSVMVVIGASRTSLTPGLVLIAVLLLAWLVQAGMHALAGEPVTRDVVYGASPGTALAAALALLMVRRLQALMAAREFRARHVSTAWFTMFALSVAGASVALSLYDIRPFLTDHDPQPGFFPVLLPLELGLLAALLAGLATGLERMHLAAWLAMLASAVVMATIFGEILKEIAPVRSSVETVTLDHLLSIVAGSGLCVAWFAFGIVTRRLATSGSWRMTAPPAAPATA